MNGLYELETTAMDDTTSIAKRHTSTATLMNAAMRRLLSESSFDSASMQGGTNSLPFSGAAIMFAVDLSASFACRNFRI